MSNIVQSSTKEVLQQVLVDIIQNRSNLVSQTEQQRQQMEVGEAQLVKFSQLIAALQIVLGDDANITKADEQAAANAIVGMTSSSPTPPAAANS